MLPHPGVEMCIKDWSISWKILNFLIMDGEGEGREGATVVVVVMMARVMMIVKVCDGDNMTEEMRAQVIVLMKVIIVMMEVHRLSHYLYTYIHNHKSELTRYYTQLYTTYVLGIQTHTLVNTATRISRHSVYPTTHRSKHPVYQSHRGQKNLVYKPHSCYVPTVTH